MRIAILWYSATGNTRFLLKGFSERLVERGHEVELIEMATVGEREPELESFELIGFAFPVMIFRPPYAAMRFISALSPLKNAKTMPRQKR